MTPSAAVGVLESVFWRPEFHWRPRAIDVLRPVRWAHLMRNEIDDRQTFDMAQRWAKTGSGCFDAATKRDQRHTLLLRDVAYVVHADVEVAQGSNDPAKYRDQFRRRVARGRHFAQPYLGCREFLANVAEPDGTDEPIDLDLELGRVLFRVERDERGRLVEAVFGEARVTGGRFIVSGEPGGD
jgi:CRISPR-associated protein Cas5d